jgi:WD40 repeat protein
MVLSGHGTYVYPVAYSPDGQWIASGSWDGTVRLWDARTGEPGAMLRHPTLVRALAFSPDGSWLVSGCDEQVELRIWEIATGQLRKRIPAPGTAVQAITVNPAGDRIAAADRFGQVSIMDVATGQELATYRTARHWTEKRALAYSPDGRWLVGTGEDGNDIDIWDAHTLKRSCRLVGHTATVYTVAFSRDGRLLVSAGQDRTARLWDTAGWEHPTPHTPLTTLEGHTDEVFAAVFHPDGRRVATAGRDRAILVWDVATGAEVARLHGHRNYVFSLDFSPDGRTLASGSGDFTIRLWDTEPLAVRLEARHNAEGERPEADRLVEQTFRDAKDTAQATRTLLSDRSLKDSFRREIQKAIWRRLAATNAASANR